MINDARLFAIYLAMVVLAFAAFLWLVMRPELLDSLPPTATITAAPSAQDAAITTAGVLVVGRDVDEGTYQTFAPPGCTWAVLSDVDSHADGRAVTRSGEGPGAVAVRLGTYDAALVSVGCGPWVELR